MATAWPNWRRETRPRAQRVVAPAFRPKRTKTLLIELVRQPERRRALIGYNHRPPAAAGGEFTDEWRGGWWWNASTLIFTLITPSGYTLEALLWSPARTCVL